MRNKKLAGNKPNNSTQKYLDIAEIKDDMVVLNDGTVRGVLLVSSINFDLKSEDEQNAVVSGYVGFLNSLDYPIQIIVQSRPLNIDDYLEKLKSMEKEQTNKLLRMQTADYRKFISELITMEKIMTKKFYVVVPYMPGRGKRKSFYERMIGTFSIAKTITMSQKRFDEYGKELDKNCHFISSNLSSLGLKIQRLDTQSLYL